MKKLIVLGMLLAAVAWPRGAAHADIAPPKTPPGSALLPGYEGTAVRMLAETVTLDVAANPSQPERAIARTRAVFTMRNFGHVDENMAARFPLSFPDGSSDGAFEFPEIPTIEVKVDGRPVATRREMQPPIEDGGYQERDEIPWAVFDVAFPRDQDVIVEVAYNVVSYGYYPEAIFEYVLETGAGWDDTIGEADIIVQLPYEASKANVFIDESNGASASTPEAVLSDNRVRWHYEDLEPTAQSNIQVILITPSLWQSIVDEGEAVQRNPKDGEAWGRLAKAYKEAARQPKGWLRDDRAGRELVDRSRQAYEQCLELLPRDPLWHYGYADLLWSEYYWEVRNSPNGDTRGLLPRLLTELQMTLELDPDNQPARELLLEISLAVEGAVEQMGDQYHFLALTATPHPPTPYLDPGTPTASPVGKATGSALPASTSVPPGAVASPPLCGGALVTLILPAGVVAIGGAGRMRRGR